MLQKFKDIAASNPESLQYAPSLLQRMALGIMAVLTLMSFALANVQALLWMQSDWLVSTILPAVIVDLTNEERLTTTPLARNAVLDEAARLKAEHMATKGYFAHYSPDGISPWYWFDAAGYSFVHAGENLAVLFTDSEDVVDAWMNSPGHRANILNEDYREIGVGTAEGTYKGRTTVFVVQLFAAPAEAKTREIVTEAVPILAPTGSEEVVINPESEEVASAEAFAETVPQEPPVIVSDLATTSREADVVEKEADFLGHLATQPGSWLQFMYALLASAVIALLAVSVVLAWRREHAVQVLYGTGLVFVMAFLLVVHAAMTGGAVIL